MADKQQQYISALQDFSKSVEFLVEAIQNQVQNNEGAFEDIVSSTKEQAQYMSEAAKQLSVVSEDIKHTKHTTDHILNIVKSIRKEKQTGIWDKLNAKDKTSGVAEGISTIALMAGSILAIGTAFSVLGDVDFDTVIALSIALPLVAMAFSKVSESVDGPKEAAMVAASMVMMAGGVYGSGLILSYMPSLNFMQMITAVAVSVAMGVSMYALATAADQLGSGDLKRLYGILPALPITAAAISASAYILQDIPEIGTNQFLSAIGVGTAMGVSMIPLSLAARSVGGNIKDIYLLSAAMPVMAAAIVASSYVLSTLPELDSLNIIESSLAVSASTLAISGSIWAMSKMGLGIKEVALGTAAITIMSAGIMASSWILSVGNYKNYPTVDWASGVGLSMLGYLPSVLATGAIAMTGVGALVIAAGIASMIAIAGGLVSTSYILAKGKYTGGPSVEWARGVGISLMAFGNAISLMSPGLFDLIAGNSLDDKIAGIMKLGTAIKDVSYEFQGGDYTGGPKAEWARGVGLSIKYFSEALESLDTGWFGDSIDEQILKINKIAGMLPMIAKTIGQDSSLYSGGPSVEWSKGVGTAVSAFVSAIVSLNDEVDIEDINTWVPAMKQLAPLIKDFGWMLDGVPFKNYPSKDWSEGVLSFMSGFSQYSFGNNVSAQTTQIYKLAKAFTSLSRSIGYMAYSLKKIKTVPDLSNIYSGLITLSLVDSSNLNKMLYSIDKKYDQYQKLIRLVNPDTSIKNYDFNKDVVDTNKPKQQTQTTSGIKSNNTNTQTTVAQPKTTSQPVKDNTDVLLQKLIDLQQQINSTLNEIADNTSEKLHPNNFNIK